MIVYVNMTQLVLILDGWNMNYIRKYMEYNMTSVKKWTADTYNGLTARLLMIFLPVFACSFAPFC